MWKIFVSGSCAPFFPPPLQVQLGGDTTTVLLEALIPETVYAVTVSALHDEGVSEPLEGQGTTRRSPSPG